MSGTEGLKVKKERIDRAYTSGRMSFWERWSKKKEIEKKIEQRTKGRKNSGEDAQR